MPARFIADLAGTLRNFFRFGSGSATHTLSTNATLPRTATFQDSSGTVAYTSDIISANAVDETPAGAVDSVNTVFTLSQTPVANSLQVFVNGLRQNLTEDYSRVGPTLTFVVAPTTGQEVRASYIVSLPIAGTQPLDQDLTAIAALSGTGFARRTGTNTWDLVPQVSTSHISDDAITSDKLADGAVGALAINPTVVSGQPSTLTADIDDELLIRVAADGTLRKIKVSDLISGTSYTFLLTFSLPITYSTAGFVAQTII